MIDIVERRYRSIQVKTRLNEKEYHLLSQKIKASGLKKSVYLRKMILDGYIIHQDYGVLKECVAALGRIGNNLNQLTKVANTYHDIDVPELKRLADEVSEWRQHFLRELR